MNIAATSFDAASASQVKLKDAYFGGLKEPHEREGNSGETDDSESEPWYCKPAPQSNEACGNRKISRIRVFRIPEKSKQ